MELFEETPWVTTLHVEAFTTPSQKQATIAYYTVSDWNIPFTYETWASKLGFTVGGPFNIYQHCSDKLTRKECKLLVMEASTRLYIEPYQIAPFEKMASFYILRLLAGLGRKSVWKEWQQIPIPLGLLEDEIFCLCVVALHPVLYGKLHPNGRNNRRVCLEAIAQWNLTSFSFMQFAHPNSMRLFKGRQVDLSDVGRRIQSHNDSDYWAFDDISLVLKAVGKPGARKWSELEFAGPTAVHFIVSEREKHGSSTSVLEKYIQKNKYM